MTQTSMSEPIVIAILTGAVSIIVVVISSVIAIITIRKNSEATRTLEFYRFHLDAQSIREKTSRQLIENRVDAIGESCSLLQLIRDDARMVIKTGILDQEIANKIFENGVDLQGLYAHRHYILDVADRIILHDAKSHVMEISALFMAHYHKQNSLDGDWFTEEVPRLLDVIHKDQKLLIQEYEKLTEFLRRSPETFIGPTGF